MRKAILAVGLALSLAACGYEPPAPTEGVITSMPYGGESFWYSSDCGQYRNVIKTRTKRVKVGKSYTMRTETYTDRVCVQHLTIPHRKAPWWQICITPQGRDQHCLNVDEHVYRAHTIGGYFKAGA